MTKDDHHHLHVRYQAGGAEFQVAIPVGRSDKVAKIALEFYSGLPDVDDTVTHLLINRRTGAIAIRPDGDSVHAVLFGSEDDFPSEDVL